MANLFELAAKLTLDSSDYEKGIEAAKQAAANFAKGLTSVVTAVTTTDRAVNNAADSAENLGAGTSNAADGVNMLNQAEAQTTQAANAMARAEENAADSAENLSQSAENASESISETEQSASSSVSKFKNFQSAIQTIISKFGEFARSNNTVQRAVETVKTKFETFRGVLDKAKSKIQEVTDKGKNLADRGLSKIQSGIEKVKSKFEPAINAFSKAKGWLEKLKDKFKKVGDEEDKTSEKTLKFGDIVKSILTADAIKAGLGMLWSGIKRVGQAFINLGKSAVDAYGNYEQLADGVKKLYGNASKIVMENAKQAYKTSGMSANQYMEQATMFSAALVNSLGGNTKKAAELTDVAMRSIADNFNTFGGDIESVKNAFSGFSKQNFAMLDNLRLGYGGTKSEMERLISDANEYAKTIGEASNLSIDSFADIVTAIDLVQRKQKIAGTTTEEAQKTIQGSLNMTKAAWENLLVGIADENADFDTLIDNLIDSATAAGENLIPRVEQVIKGIGRAIEKLLPIALEEAPKAIARYAPEVWNTVKNLLSIIYTSLNDTLVNTDWNALGGKIADGINNIDWVSLFGDIGETISNALVATLNLLSGFVENVDWFNLGQEIFYSIVAVVENIDWQEVVATAFRLLGAAIGGAGALIGGLSTAIKSVFEMAKAEVKAYFDEKIKEAGGNVVKGIFNGIIEGLANVGSWIYNNIFLPFINGFKAAFGIHSPSTVMITMGKYLIDGLLNGIKNAPARVMEVFGQVKNKITSWGSGILTTVRQIGGHLMTGLISGINDKVGSVYKKISDVGQSIVSKVKSVFGVHSPSTVMKQIGDYLMQGLSIGISENSSDAVSSVEKLSSKIKNAFDSDVLSAKFGELPDLNTDISASLTASNATMNTESNTDRLLMMILETLTQLDDGMKDKIKSAVDGMGFNWNDREVGRFVKSYA